MTRDEWIAMVSRNTVRRNEQDALALEHAQAGRPVRAALHSFAAALHHAASYAALAGMVRQHGPIPVALVMQSPAASDDLGDTRAATERPN